MNWITESIGIGNYLDAQDVGLLRQESIRSILSLTGSLPITDPFELGVKEVEVVALRDGPGNDVRLFQRAVDTLERLVKTNAPVLVHCHAGRSRSPVVVAGYLMRSLGIGTAEALALIAAKREIAVTEGLVHLLDSME